MILLPHSQKNILWVRKNKFDLQCEAEEDQEKSSHLNSLQKALTEN